MISTHGLTKHYGAVKALQNVSVQVRQGEVLGLLGPNGSGKTTMIRILTGMLKPTSGRAEVAGFPCWRDSIEVRRCVSYLPGELRLPGYMTGIGVLKFLSGLRNGSCLDRAEAIAVNIMKLDLTRKVRTYSTGMKQKLAIAQTFADPVDLLILDEPTSALDPSARQDVVNLVIEARAAGQTVVFSGHVLSEVEQVADSVAIMRKGKLMHVEDMHKRRQNVRLILMRCEGPSLDHFPEELQITVRERTGDTLLLEHRGEVPPLLAWLTHQNIVDLAIGSDDLKSLYDQYHGPNIKDEIDEGQNP